MFKLRKRVDLSYYDPEMLVNVNGKLYSYIARPKVYTSYIFDKMDKNIWNWGHNTGNNSVIIGISTQALKDLKFKVCDIAEFGSCDHPRNIENLLISGEGNLKRKPIMTKLKNHINNSDDDDTVINHEVIFDKIPVKYFRVIMIPQNLEDQYVKKYHKSFTEKLQNYLKDSIPVITYNKDFNYKILEKYS